MTGFASIPIVVGSNIICEWIELKDLVNLDNACNNHLSRSAYLSYCQSGTIKTGHIDLESSGQIQWFIIRKLRFQKVSISFLNWQEDINTLLSELLDSIGSHIKEFEICPHTSLSSEQIVCLNAIIVQKCLNVQKIEVTGCCTDLELTPLLSDWKYIQQLIISDCKMTSAILYIIANTYTRKLKCLSLQSIPDICDAGLTALAGNCPELEELNILWCRRITSKAMLTLVETIPNLTILRISMPDLTDSDITIVAQHCPMLHTLAVNAALLTDVGMQAVVSHCTQLRTIDICNCILISTGLGLFLNLHKLSLFECPTLTDTMVATIVQNNPLLDCILLYGCPQLTAAAVVSILQGCCELNTLTVTSSTITTPVSEVHIVCCSLVSALIKAHYPKLTTLYIELK